MKLLLLLIILGVISDDVVGQPTTGKNGSQITYIFTEKQEIAEQSLARIEDQIDKLTRRVEVIEGKSERPNSPQRGIRLAGGNFMSGRLEVEYKDRWGTVCGSGFGQNEAHVVCKQLGFWSGKSYSSAAFGHGHMDIIVSNVVCNGDEEYLDECGHGPWGNPSCSQNDAIGIVCYNGPLGADVHYMETIKQESRGTLYLGYISGDNLLVRHSCGDLLTDLSGGYADKEELLEAGGNFGCILTSVGLSDPERTDACKIASQQDIRLSDCLSCTHMFVCVEYPDTKGLLLIEGEHVGSGRLMVLNNGLWTPVCFRRFDIVDASVVCRTLGYRSGINRYTTHNSREGYGWLEDVQCSGDETEFMDCRNDGFDLWSCSYDVYITCANETCGSHMQELNDVSNNTLGNGFDYLCYISHNDTSVAEMSCEDLLRDLQGGFSDSTSLTAGGGRFGCYKTMNGLNDPRRYDACQDGHEITGALSDCSSCTHMFICIDYPVARLVNSPYGRYDVLHQGIWGGVCYNGFNDTDATVACRTLGYQSGVYRGLTYVPTLGFSWLAYIQCRGDEVSLFDCAHRVSHSCNHFARISCA